MTIPPEYVSPALNWRTSQTFFNGASTAPTSLKKHSYISSAMKGVDFRSIHRSCTQLIGTFNFHNNFMNGKQNSIPFTRRLGIRIVQNEMPKEIRPPKIFDPLGRFKDKTAEQFATIDTAYTITSRPTSTNSAQSKTNSAVQSASLATAASAASSPPIPSKSAQMTKEFEAKEKTDISHRKEGPVKAEATSAAHVVFNFTSPYEPGNRDSIYKEFVASIQNEAHGYSTSEQSEICKNVIKLINDSWNHIDPKTNIFAKLNIVATVLMQSMAKFYGRDSLPCSLLEIVVFRHFLRELGEAYVCNARGEPKILRIHVRLFPLGSLCDLIYFNFMTNLLADIWNCCDVEKLKKTSSFLIELLARHKNSDTLTDLLERFSIRISPDTVEWRMMNYVLNSELIKNKKNSRG